MGLGANRPLMNRPSGDIVILYVAQLRMKSDVLSTRQVAQLLGVGEATVKRWADAGEIDCFRTPGGHRKFRLREVTAFVQKRDYGASLPEAANDDDPVERFAGSALRGDTSALVAQLASLRLRGLELPELFDEVVAPALHRIGELWCEKQLSIAEEHVASQAVIETIARAQPLAEPPGEAVRADRGVAIVAAAAGEQHDIGPRMAACLLRARGFEVLAPLAQTPARDLAELVVRSRAALVALGGTMDTPAALEQVRLAAHVARQTGARVLIGGAAMQRLELPDASYLPGMRALVAESDGAGRRRTRA